MVPTLFFSNGKIGQEIGEEMRQQKKQDHGLMSNFTLAYNINFLYTLKKG